MKFDRNLIIICVSNILCIGFNIFLYIGKNTVFNLVSIIVVAIASVCSIVFFIIHVKVNGKEIDAKKNEQLIYKDNKKVMVKVGIWLGMMMLATATIPILTMISLFLYIF